MGILTFSSISKAIGWEGTLTASVLLPWDKRYDRAVFLTCNIIVSGPGQNWFANKWAVCVKSTIFSASCLLKVWAIKGLLEGRFLAT